MCVTLPSNILTIFNERTKFPKMDKKALISFGKGGERAVFITSTHSVFITND